jgi:adenine-specific DNA methylase
MSNQTSDSPDNKRNRLKIEDSLPVTAVGIESVKESYTDAMSPHRKIYKWFARRPTSASRLAILASLLPDDTSDDELLKYLGIGPRGRGTDIENYVIEKERTREDRSGSVEDHFGYPYPHRTLPSESEFEQLHNTLRENWDGNLPLVLDPTAGGGTIPFESARYGLPTISNELNPIGWLINKVILDYGQSVGSLQNEVNVWTKKIQETTAEQLREYFPKKKGVEPNYYFRAYSISCPSCGDRFALSNQWWFNKRNNIAILPKYNQGDITYECGHIDELSCGDDFDPSNGTVDGGDAECPHCGVVTERDQLVEIFKSDEYEYEVCAVKYLKDIGGTKYHSPTTEDYEAVERAQQKVDSDLELSTLLREDRYIGLYDRSGPYGLTQWRDLYSPRQLIAHHSYLEAFDELKPDIRETYDDKKAEAILVLLSLISTRQIARNARLAPMNVHFGYVGSMLATNNYTFQWHFGEANPTAGGQSFESFTENTLDAYEEVCGYYPPEHLRAESRVLQGDASSLPLDDESVESVIIDPPYGDNIMYAEVADAFYVWLRQYLGDVFPDKFQSRETNKQDEAVENPVIVDESQNNSGVDSAREHYEDKMRNIFTESNRVLETGGIITVFFTDKEVSAWDSLTMSLIDAGFTITATHTISSERPGRIGVKDQSSADSSLFLTCRKPTEKDNMESNIPTLWSDIRNRTYDAAQRKATSLLESTQNLTKTDIIISAFGPTLRVFTEEYPVVDKHDNPVRPKRALEEARRAVTEVLIEHELNRSLDDVDSLSTWYILCWLVYGRTTIPYDEARQLGLGVGANIDELKSETKIWGKSSNQLVIKGESYRVRDYDKLEAGEKRRARAYPIDPRSESFEYTIDAVHASLNVLKTKGSDFAWNWINDRGLQDQPQFRQTVISLLQVMPASFEDYDLLVNLVSGETGELLDIDAASYLQERESDESKETTLNDF